MIVGASFAGLICARSAALPGLKVIVIESKSDPGARIHTTSILSRKPPRKLIRRKILSRHSRREALFSIAQIDGFARPHPKRF